MSDLSFISFPLPSYKIDIDWPNKRSFHSQSFLFKLNSYVQMTSSKKQEIFSNKFSMQYKWVLCKMTCTWFECMRDDGWIYGMTFVFCGLSQIWDCDMCTGYLVVICRTVLLLHLHNVHPRATLSLKTYQKITNQSENKNIMWHTETYKIHNTKIVRTWK